MRVHGVSTWAESGSGRCTVKKTRRTIITWIASTTPAAGAGAVPEQGLSRQAEQPSLFLWDVIAASPNRFLDRAFVQAYVCHCGVLLKLLDTAERLNVQVHPDRLQPGGSETPPTGKRSAGIFSPEERLTGSLRFFIWDFGSM